MRLARLALIGSGLPTLGEHTIMADWSWDEPLAVVPPSN
jgi:hypothetical protein